MSYTIKLPEFEGPFDLLLFFIERDELDIYDIPIAKITKDFLEYIKMMESMNIDLASEFILVAATLMKIKSKLLIPRKELDEEGNEIDPREELVERLLEYKRYKSVIDDLRALEKNRMQQNARGNAVQELQQIANKALVDAELESLTLFKLLRAYENILTQYEDATKKSIHTVIKYDYTIERQKEVIVTLAKTKGKLGFRQLFTICENRIHAIFTFLALLELLQLESINILIGEGINNFWITAT